MDAGSVLGSVRLRSLDEICVREKCTRGDISYMRYFLNKYKNLLIIKLLCVLMTIPYSNEETDHEPNKILYDFFKHLTTLNTGSIFIILTFWKNVLDLESKLLVFSLAGFIFSLMFSVYLMHVIAYPIKPKKLNSINYLIHFLSWICFLFGIVAITYFVIDIT